MKPLRVEHGGQIIAAADGGWRILETTHPPVYYLAPNALHVELRPNERSSFCEFKGMARYWDLIMENNLVIADVGWSYPQPVPAYAAIADHVAFYASRVDACYVGDERVAAQAGDFYGGWITTSVVGPFKGAAGTWGW